jgi:hypothetical protein
MSINASSQKLTEKQKQIIMEIQKKNNRKLAEIINIDLKKYGYY